jgi:hypothetical protein
LGKRTIFDWVAITKNEKSGWSQFYKEYMGYPLSDTTRFIKAVEDFGHSIMFEAVIAASTRKLEGDPLGYVMAIALAKVREKVEEISEDARYKMRMERSKQRIAMQNEELEAKLERARIANGITE